VADHLRKRRLDLGLTRKAAGAQLGVGPWTYTRWESGTMDIQVRYFPAIIGFLRYNPLPEPASFGEVVSRERKGKGLRRIALAQRIGVTEGAIQRLEEDRRGVTPRIKQSVARALDLDYPCDEATKPRAH